MTAEFLTNDEVILAARRELNDTLWAYVCGGSESETTMRRNRLAFDRLGFRPRVLVDVSNIDTSTSFLGQSLRTPIILAPVGQLDRLAPEGGIAAAKAASEFGTIDTVSFYSSSLERIAESTNSPKIFQLYVHGDAGWIAETIERVVDAGYMGICVTVDHAMVSRRERHMLSARISMGSWPLVGEAAYQASLTWDTIDTIKDLCALPMMVKGIMTVEDAALAMEHGVEAIWISNHGGRELDHGLGTMDVLGEIVQVVDDRVEVVLDGGVQRGSDVLKAIALGAKAVAIGKLQAWGLAAAGEAGLLRVLQILKSEVRVSMGLLGLPNIQGLNSTYIRSTEPVILPHEMSSWVNLPGGRIG